MPRCISATMECSVTKVLLGVSVDSYQKGDLRGRPCISHQPQARDYTQHRALLCLWTAQAEMDWSTVVESALTDGIFMGTTALQVRLEYYSAGVLWMCSASKNDGTNILACINVMCSAFLKTNCVDRCQPSQVWGGQQYYAAKILESSNSLEKAAMPVFVSPCFKYYSGHLVDEHRANRSWVHVVCTLLGMTLKLWQAIFCMEAILVEDDSDEIANHCLLLEVFNTRGRHPKEGKDQWDMPQWCEKIKNQKYHAQIPTTICTSKGFGIHTGVCSHVREAWLAAAVKCSVTEIHARSTPYWSADAGYEATRLSSFKGAQFFPNLSRKLMASSTAARCCSPTLMQVLFPCTAEGVASMQDNKMHQGFYRSSSCSPTLPLVWPRIDCLVILTMAQFANACIGLLPTIPLAWQIPLTILLQMWVN